VREVRFTIGSREKRKTNVENEFKDIVTKEFHDVVQKRSACAPNRLEHCDRVTSAT
jgi:hypothetical protein